MSVRVDPPTEDMPYPVIHADEPVAIVPAAEMRRLLAIKRHSTPEAIAAAEAEAAAAEASPQ
jgi:hypothetical protein